MICPVCEHQQDFGVECEVCGKDLGGLGDLGAPPAASQVVEGLEQTVGERLGEVPVERVAELEVTRFSAATSAPVIEIDDLERTENAEVGDVASERMADLSDDRAPDDGVRTAAPVGPVTCRYCQNVQAVGSVCDRCGYRLPRALVTGGAAVGGPRADRTRCRACGANAARAGERCTECGALAPAEG